MAKNISLLGADYPDVPATTLPKTGGGTATFWDIDDTTASASDVLSGKYFHASDGTKTQGSIANGTITNNTSGGTSSGTVNRGSQIKIGAGYYASDAYYTAQANSGTKTVTSAGTTSCDGYANVNVTDSPLLEVSVSATSSTSTTISNNKITANHVVVNDAQVAGANISWSTSSGQLTISCSGGIPAMTLHLAVLG